MIGQYPRPSVPQPLRHRGGTLDVGEQECERLRGHSPTLPRRGRLRPHRPERPPASSTEQRKYHTSTAACRNGQHDCAGNMAESAIDARPDLETGEATLAHAPAGLSDGPERTAES